MKQKWELAATARGSNPFHLHSLDNNRPRGSLPQISLAALTMVASCHPVSSSLNRSQRMSTAKTMEAIRMGAIKMVVTPVLVTTVVLFIMTAATVVEVVTIMEVTTEEVTTEEVVTMEVVTTGVEATMAEVATMVVTVAATVVVATMEAMVEMEVAMVVAETEDISSTQLSLPLCSPVADTQLSHIKNKLNQSKMKMK